MRSCLICDDHALVRDALAAAIARRWPDCRVAQGASFADALALAAEQPDLCLIDLMMPEGEPVQAIAAIREAAPDSAIVIVTGSSDDALMLRLLRQGVRGFVHKTAESRVILAAIELVLAGGTYVPPRVAEIAAGAPAPTSRQRQILGLVAEGRSNKEIARALAISPATVKTHVAHAIALTGAANRTEAAIRAREQGII